MGVLVEQYFTLFRLVVQRFWGGFWMFEKNCEIGSGCDQCKAGEAEEFDDFVIEVKTACALEGSALGEEMASRRAFL